MNPIDVLPPEILLHALRYLTPTDLASLTRVSRAYHIFIDELNQERIYASQCETSLARYGPSRQWGRRLFTPYLRTSNSAKEQCKRRHVLWRQWTRREPTMQFGVFPSGKQVWRFRCDFERRFFITTQEEGGLTVVDMDSGSVLWSLPLEMAHENAHLEYWQGWMCFDASRASIQVWRHDEHERGTFHKIAELPRDFEVRGFMLKYSTLVVVSEDSQAWVWSLPDGEGQPKLQRSLQITGGALGHLTQNEDMVMISLGHKGYHFHDKESGKLEGQLVPRPNYKTFHAEHPTKPWHVANKIFNPQHSNPMDDEDIPPFGGWASAPEGTLNQLRLSQGPEPNTEVMHAFELDQWGAGQLEDDIMVGISRQGRLCICFNWRAAMLSDAAMCENTVIIECLSNPRIFNMGGWLSIRNKKVVWQVSDQFYFLQLSDDTTPQNFQDTARLHACSCGGLAVNSYPVSCIEVVEDAVIHTFAAYHAPSSRFDLRKAVRVISFAPVLAESQLKSAG